MKLNEHQLDSLKELGNIGASHAATSLSQLLTSMVDITVPEVRIIDISQISNQISEDIAAFVLFEIQGELSPAGIVCLYLPKESAVHLSNSMLGLSDPDREITEMDESVLLEVGNIMVSQFLDATASLLDIVMIPSPPSIAIDMGLAIFESIIALVAKDINQIILFMTELRCEEHEIQGSIFLMPGCSTMNDILALLDRASQGV
jgi:chemotaxis protein CheC